MQHTTVMLSGVGVGATGFTAEPGEVQAHRVRTASAERVRSKSVVMTNSFVPICADIVGVIRLISAFLRRANPSGAVTTAKRARRVVMFSDSAGLIARRLRT